LKQIDILELNIIGQIPKEPIKFRSKIVIKIITEAMITSAILANLKSIKKTMITVRGKSGKEANKAIYKLSYKKTTSTSFNLGLTTDGGLPIKRFVEGNYVTPSISKVLGIECKCKEFDFHDIEL
jgi:tRNA pseudouridine synthase 10